MSISEFPLSTTDSSPDTVAPALQVIPGGRAAGGAEAKELGEQISPTAR
ncbi:MAG TPA: hypothetical protein VIC82_11510 [Candidatus Nanopelagicales bacterium]|jgi:hypothetical protein